MMKNANLWADYMCKIIKDWRSREEAGNMMVLLWKINLNNNFIITLDVVDGLFS